VVQKIKPKNGKEEAQEQLLAPDDFITHTARAFQWLQDNSRTVLGVIGGLFAVAAVLGGVTVWQSRTHADASLKLARALKVYHRPVSTTPPPGDPAEDEKPFATAKEKYTAARDALEPVVAEYGQNGVGLIAGLYLADAHARLEQWDKASDLNRKYLEGTGGDDPLRFLALQALGTALEAAGDRAGAVKAFQDMETLPAKLGRDIGVFHAGRVLLSQADTKEQGKKLLEKLAKEKDYEASSLKTKAEELLTAAP
jgi:tetratricopeptide (TPR) repeat protein